jgi:hypothetical protein
MVEPAVAMNAALLHADVVGTTATAVGEVVGQVMDRLGPSPDVAMLFISPSHLERAADIAGTVLKTLAPGHLLGCSAGAVLAQRQEVEQAPGLVLWVGRTGPLSLIAKDQGNEPLIQGGENRPGIELHDAPIPTNCQRRGGQADDGKPRPQQRRQHQPVELPGDVTGLGETTPASGVADALAGVIASADNMPVAAAAMRDEEPSPGRSAMRGRDLPGQTLDHQRTRRHGPVFIGDEATAQFDEVLIVHCKSG